MTDPKGPEKLGKKHPGSQGLEDIVKNWYYKKKKLGRRERTKC